MYKKTYFAFGLIVPLLIFFISSCANGYQKTGTAANVKFEITNKLPHPVNFNYSYKSTDTIIDKKIPVKANTTTNIEIKGIQSIDLDFSYTKESDPLAEPITCKVEFRTHGKPNHQFAAVMINKEGKCDILFK